MFVFLIFLIACIASFIGGICFDKFAIPAIMKKLKGGK